MKLEANPLGDTLLKDVFGFNLPRLLFTRTWKERLDLATSEFSNTAITIFGSLLLPRLLRIPASKISKVLITELEGETLAHLAPKTKLARLAVAFGFMFPFAGAFWSASFFRNWLTLKRTKSANFDAIIGLESEKKPNSMKRSVEEETRYQRNMVFKINAIGVALGLASFLGLAFKARNFQGQALSKGMEWLYKKFDLTGKANFFGKGADQIAEGLSTFVFWLAPAYFGWLQSARTKNELKEQALKMCNSFLWFSFFTPLVVNRIFGRKFKPLLQEAGLYQAPEAPKNFFDKVRKLLTNPHKIPSFDEIQAITNPAKAEVKAKMMTLKNWKVAMSFLITITMLGITPQILNMILTRRRFEREHHQKGQHPLPLQAPNAPIPSLPQIPALPVTSQPISLPIAVFPISRPVLPPLALPPIPMKAPLFPPSLEIPASPFRLTPPLTLPEIYPA